MIGLEKSTRVGGVRVAHLSFLYCLFFLSSFYVLCPMLTVSVVCVFLIKHVYVLTRTVIYWKHNNVHVLN
jgi:hypothetical protein